MSARIQVVDTDQLVANPRNLRDHLPDVDELAASLRAVGLLQPLVVNDTGRGLVVTDGHRRLAAAQQAGIPRLLCIITTGHEAPKVAATMLAASMHRQLTPLEQARAFQDLRCHGMTTWGIHLATGYSTALIRSRLGLLDLPADAQTMLDDGQLTLRAATDLAQQVKASRTGTMHLQGTRSAWFTQAHPLAVAVTSCDHGHKRTLVGGVACGQCWEAAIRADERGELDVAPPHDEAVVERVLNGERLRMSRADRLEGVRRLTSRGWSDRRIARQLGCSDRQVLRDRQTLDIPSPLIGKAV